MDGETIRAWANSRSAAKRIAADLALKIKAGRIERYSDLPSTESLAAEWEVSADTVLRAKRALAGHKLARVEGGRYIVA